MGCLGGSPFSTNQFLNPKTKDITFLNKSYDEWDKVKNPAVVPISYRGSDKERVKTVPKNINSNDNYNVVGDSESNDDEENVFEQNVYAKFELILKTTQTPNMMRAMKN